LQCDLTGLLVQSCREGNHANEAIAKNRQATVQLIGTAFFMASFHIGVVASLFFFTWKALLVANLLWWISRSVGIGMGYPRLLTHRGYQTPKWVEYFLTISATLTLEGGPSFWVATHRIHHKFTDQEGDPHPPRDGKWWSRIGWILIGQSMHHDTTTWARYVPDLA
jgi:fatty-acid desaturase